LNYKGSAAFTGQFDLKERDSSTSAFSGERDRRFRSIVTGCAA